MLTSFDNINCFATDFDKILKSLVEISIPLTRVGTPFNRKNYKFCIECHTNVIGLMRKAYI